MAGSALTVKVRIDGAREMLASFKGLPKEASAELRVASLELSTLLAAKAKANAAAQGRQAALLAATVRPARDRVPAVVAGGARAIGHPWPKRGRGKAFELLFGSEFGGHGHGFLPHRGRNSYWFFRAVDEDEREIGDAWTEAAERIRAKFNDAGALSRGPEL